MSVQPHDDELTIIIRTIEGSKCMQVTEDGSNITDYVSLAKQLYPDLHIDHFENCVNIKAPQHIKAFDEKLETQKFKFGVIYQRKGQVRELHFSIRSHFYSFRQLKKNFSTTKNIIEILMNFLISSLLEFH